MKKSICILCAFLLVSAVNVTAQSKNNERFAVKASAGFGLGNTLSISSGLSALTGKASSGNYGADFGWTCWKRSNHTLEVNVGVAYTPTSQSLGLETLQYDYDAPESADMDGVAYRRYYELYDLSQKVSIGQFSGPLYLTYAYKCNHWLGVHVDVGACLGFKTGGRVSRMSGVAYSYGVYPQYGDLKIDAPYMNDFGTADLAQAGFGRPRVSGLETAVLVGAGAEFRICGPLAADLSLRYGAGMTPLFKGGTTATGPVSYTVSEGQQVQSLSDFLTGSRRNQVSLRVAVVCRF